MWVRHISCMDCSSSDRPSGVGLQKPPFLQLQTQSLCRSCVGISLWCLPQPSPSTVAGGVTLTLLYTLLHDLLAIPLSPAWDLYAPNVNGYGSSCWGGLCLWPCSIYHLPDPELCCGFLYICHSMCSGATPPLGRVSEE